MLEEKLKNHIIEKYGSVRQFAFQINIPYTTVDSILKRGIDNSNVGNVIKICKALNLSIDNLLNNEEYMSSLNFDNGTIININADIEVIKIPVLGHIKAGVPVEAQEDIIDYVEIPQLWLKGGREFFALKLDGDSMEPEYHDKDTVIFLKSCDCESGQDCCVRINGFDATFKRIKKQENGIMIIPLNENNSSGFSTTFYTNEDIEKMPIEILGIVKRVITDK